MRSQTRANARWPAVPNPRSRTPTYGSSTARHSRSSGTTAGLGGQGSVPNHWTANSARVVSVGACTRTPQPVSSSAMLVAQQAHLTSLIDGFRFRVHLELVVAALYV